MKVACVFATDMAATFELNTMILPQLEEGIHGAEVVGMMFFDDNLWVLRAGAPFGERLAKMEKSTTFCGWPATSARSGVAWGKATSIGAAAARRGRRG